jgi:hypothetical protein
MMHDFSQLESILLIMALLCSRERFLIAGQRLRGRQRAQSPWHRKRNRWVADRIGKSLVSKHSLTSKEKGSSDEMADSVEAKTIVSGGLDAADGGCGLKMEACSNVQR